MPDNQTFPIPDELEPDTYCLCIPMPNDPTWKQTIVGLLAQPTYWFNWDRDSARSGKVLAAYWTKLFDQIEWGTMSCCCGNQPPLIFRYGPGNVYQSSSDGGITWQDAPQFDPRIISTTQPNPNDLGVVTTRCTGADSVAQTIQDGMVENLNDSMTAAQIVATVAAVLLIFLTAGTLGALSAQLVAVGAAIITAGVTAYQAAFTPEVWESFRCIIWRHLSDDLTITQEGVDAIIEELHATFAGLAHMGLLTAVQVAGPVGLTNMARSGNGDPDADCSSCDNTPQVWISDLVNPAVQIFPAEDGTYTATQSGTGTGDGFYWIVIQFAEVLDTTNWIPCNGLTDVTGQPGFHQNLDCHTGTDNPLSTCVACVTNRSNTPGFVMTFKLANPDEPCS